VEVDRGEVLGAAEVAHQLVSRVEVFRVAVEGVDDGAAGRGVFVEGRLLVRGEVDPRGGRVLAGSELGLAERAAQGRRDGGVGRVDRAGEVQREAPHARAGLEDLQRRRRVVVGVLARARRVQIKQ